MAEENQVNVVSSGGKSDNFETALFALAFRPFFLFGALFAVLVMVVWIAALNQELPMKFYGGAFFWHVHEMLFGYVAAIVVGFLLTAVQNWTGERSVNGLALGVLLLLWITARVGLLFIHEPNIWIASIDISFFVVAAVFLAIPIVAARQWRNLFFVPVLALFAFANGMMHLGALNQEHALVVNGADGALGLICLLMVTMGGRIIPVFTANGTATARVPPWPWLERLSLGSVWLIVIVLLPGLDRQLPAYVMCGLFGFAAITNFVRWFRWRFWITFGVALLWTLHLAYLFIVAGFAALAVSYVTGSFAASIAWHLVTVGGIGGLTLSMISRVSLGHTGRPIVALKWMLPAYVAVFVAAITRTLMVVLMPAQYSLWLQVSAGLWILAFGSFVGCYALMLIRPRTDGRPG